MVDVLKIEKDETFTKTNQEDISNKLKDTNDIISSSLQVNTITAGNENRLHWTPNNTSLSINIELYKNGTYLMPIADNIPNSGTHNWRTMKSIDFGEDYQIKIFDVSNPQNSVISNYFKIKKDFEFFSSSFFKGIVAVGLGIVLALVLLM